MLLWGFFLCFAYTLFFYSTCNSPIEEYIDLNYIADRLMLDEDIFANVTNVCVK